MARNPFEEKDKMICDHCAGSGKDRDGKTCPSCKGSGRKPSR
jgi:DnaJ-class molecular chaperone